MDIFLPILGLLMIMVFIVGATIGINNVMKGKVINLLLNKKLLLIIASIISAFFALAFMMSGLYIEGWVEVFWFVYFIGFIFVIARYTPDLVLHLKKIHLSNLEDAEQQELRESR
jgi:MFS family permease